MKSIALAVLFAVVAVPCAADPAPRTPVRPEVPMSSPPLLKKSTPVVVVERIEPVLPFWRKLGLAPTVEVPEEGAAPPRTGFAILATDGVEVMYQTLTSVQSDLVASAADRAAFRPATQQAYLFVEVPSLAAVERALAGEKLVMPFRTTFYGAKELAYDDRAGNIVVFAEMPADAPAQ